MVDGFSKVFQKLSSWVTMGNVGILFLLLAVPGILSSYASKFPNTTGIRPILNEIYSNLTWEFVSIAFTILIIDRL